MGSGLGIFLRSKSGPDPDPPGPFFKDPNP